MPRQSTREDPRRAPRRKSIEAETNRFADGDDSGAILRVHAHRKTVSSWKEGATCEVSTAGIKEPAWRPPQPDSRRLPKGSDGRPSTNGTSLS